MIAIALGHLQGAQVALERERYWRANALRPPPRLTLSQWADRYRVLSRKASAEPGRWRTSRVPYLREIMDTLCDPKVQHVCWMKGSQIAATETGTNFVGYYMHQDPSPILVLQPTLDMARAWSIDRLDPMLAESPELRKLIVKTNRRDKGDTILHKEFGGGQVDIVGANSPSSLASRPKRILFADEVDRYPLEAGEEGDPLTLAERRLDTFWNRKVFVPSTPTIKGVSRIEHLFELSDQRHYQVPCPHCGQLLILRRRYLQWDAGKPESAHYVCSQPLDPDGRPLALVGGSTATEGAGQAQPHAGCGAVIEERDKIRMLALGRWVPTFPGRRRVGFHINALYSPFLRWSEFAAAWLEAQGRPKKLKVFVNTYLAETWNDEAIGANPDSLKARRETYPAEAPGGVGLITIGADVQGDRVEVDTWGWGEGEEHWKLRHEVVWGDPAMRATWDRVQLVIQRPWQHEHGAVIHASVAMIDSGGHHTDAVYRFCRRKFGVPCWPVKGMGGAGIAPVRMPLRKSKAKAKVIILGTDSLKDIAFAYMATEIAGPGFMHLPLDTTDEWIAGLTAEEVKKSYDKGKVVRQYIKKPGVRNEPLDMYCYALAGLLHFNETVRETLGRRAESLRKKGEELKAAAADAPAAESSEEPEKRAKRRKVRRSGFVHNY
ncbi:MAG: phage terminase large subunit family protein [Gemmatimonadaceae bacterium]|jgi:phage terminase large subunit GpA-like protein